MSLRKSEKKEPSVQTKSTDVRAGAATESQSNQNELKSKELPLRPSLPSDQCFSRWNKLKALREQNNASNFETISKLSPEERVVWKNSKLFSKTLSSIDGIRSTKKGNSSQMSSVTREYSSAELHPKNMATNPSATSPKRPSSQSSVAVPAAKHSEWKLLKSKLSLLRKKANKDNSGNCVETAIITKDIKEVNSGTGNGKHEKSAQFTSISTIESILTKKSVSSEEKGIICKKEDLMHIISEASKGVKVTKTKSFNSEEENSNGLCATTSTASSSNTSADVSIKRNSLKQQHSCGSAQSSCDLEENSKTKQSNTSTQCLDCCQPENDYKNQYQNNANKTTKDKTDDSSTNVEKSAQHLNSESNECENRLKNKIKSDISSKRKPINETNLADIQTDSQTYNDEHNEHNETESNVPAVQWDDINFVDPSLLGDAIQTFLQGLAGSGSSAGSTTNEKRVSFKKSF